MVFSTPKTVRVEASFSTILELGLNEFQGEHFDFIRDVIAVEEFEGHVVLTTCRTIRDPSRTQYRIPRGLIANYAVLEPHVSRESRR